MSNRQKKKKKTKIVTIYHKAVKTLIAARIAILDEKLCLFQLYFLQEICVNTHNTKIIQQKFMIISDSY